ncbi:MAG: hypothetical protein ACLR7D_10150 [Lachnospira eligens]
MADIVHISPTHHYPTGITMPVSRRFELLAWANEKPDRYIIEDDYDSEFRMTGKTIPTMKSMNISEKVIYYGYIFKNTDPNNPNQLYGSSTTSCSNISGKT